MCNHKKWLFKSLLFIITLILNNPLYPQQLPHPVNNYGIYEFLDELANQQIISINSAVKPYTRLFIAEKLQEASERREELNNRQQKELDFYLMDFGKETNEGKDWKRRKDLYYYKDDLFSITVNPILGGEIFTNSSGEATYWRNGAEARGYVGSWGFFASLRDNHEKPLLGSPSFLIRRINGHMKSATDWSEMQGGVTFSWKWGNAGFVKDGFLWGNNYNGANIFGGNNPTFIQLRLHLNPVSWFEFNYFHGWLNSMVVDSSRSFWVANSYGLDYREVYHKKYISANFFTFTPARFLNISAGNSIIYDNRRINPAYLVPLFFYKSVDHSVSSGIDNMNSQMFFDISSRQISNLHLYATLFVDELAISRIQKKDEWNFISWKAGFSLSNYPFSDISLTTEFTYSYPLTYQHYVPTLTFETNGYNLGHYLKDNSREWYVALDYRPVRTLDIKISFTDAIRGPDYNSLGGDRVGNPPLSSVEWHLTTFGLKGSCQVINDLYTWFTFSNSNIRGKEEWNAEYFSGRKNTLNLGITFGF
jgi:hypothetical protein